jgi:hypothetical protein
MTTATYDPRNVTIIIGGIIASGFADGTFIQVERNNPSFSVVSGASGETSRIKSNDKSCKLTLTLMATSTLNDILTGFMKADEISNSGKFPITIYEITGSTVVSALEAWVSKPPRVEYGKESGTREWELEAGTLEMFVGGIQPTV